MTLLLKYFSSHNHDNNSLKAPHIINIVFIASVQICRVHF